MEKILLVDDHSIIRSGLIKMLGKDFNRYCFDEAGTPDDFIKQTTHNEYALIILDINIPGMDTFETVKSILEERPDAKILIFSMNAENVYARRFLKAGVKGYVRKDEHCEQIKTAVNHVLNNKRYVSTFLEETLLAERFKNIADNPFDKLSPKQIQIVHLLIQGKAVGDICSIMNLHTSTVSTQKLRIFEKLYINSLVELYALAKLHQANYN